MARVGAIAHVYTRIAAQPRVELAVADVHRHHRSRAALEQTVGEAAGRRADVETSALRNVHTEIVERTRELLAAARCIALRFAAHANLRGVTHARAGLVLGHVVDEDLAGADQRLRARARIGEPVSNHPLVEPQALQSFRCTA